MTRARLAFFMLVATCLGAPARASNEKLDHDCLMLFRYMESAGSADQREIAQRLGLPETPFPADLKPRPKPFGKIALAVAHASTYLPPADREDSLSLADHRAFVLRNDLNAIARIYPVWGFSAEVDSRNNYLFRGGNGDYIKIWGKDATLTRGNVFSEPGPLYRGVGGE